MFGFGKSSKDPLSDIKAAERWLATLPGADTLAVHSNVIDELERATGAGANRTPQRLRAVFHVDAQTGGGLDHVAHRVDAGTMAFDTRKMTLRRPPTVAVHDHGDVRRQPFEIDLARQRFVG